jgi:TorA maturation chaperone TorD
MYGILVRALAYPDVEHRATLRTLSDGLAPLPEQLRTVVLALAGTMPAAPVLAADHARLFTHSTSRDCPAYETAYTTREIFRQTEEMADIAGFYRAFGVEAVPASERLDHICVELEYMQLLTAKEAHTAAEGWNGRVRRCRQAERLFLRDHLGGWGQAFGRRLESADPSGWYGQTGMLLRLWIEGECRGLRVQPEQPAGEPVVPEMEPDHDGPDDGDHEGCAGCATPAAGAAIRPGAMPLPVLDR